MRRLVQVSALLVLALSGVMIATAFTAADATSTVKASPTVLQSAWFWQNAYEQANPPVAAGPPTTEPSGVPDGDLAVAHSSSDASSSKMTALAFDVSALTPGSFVNTFTFSVKVDSSPEAASSPGTAPVVACLPTRGWPSGPGDYTNEPTVDCSTKVKPKVDGSTYTFAIPQLAQSWVDDQNLGVALVNDPDNTSQPFQVVFTGDKTIKASMSYSSGTPISTGTGSGVYTGGSTVTGGSTGGSSSPVTSSGPVDVPSAALPPAASAPDAGQSPQVASSAPAAVPVAKAAAASSSAPTPGFWIAAAAIALLVLFVSVVLGDATLAAQTAPTSRLDRVLRNRSGAPLA